jgi:hypothetical protein
VPPDQRFFAAGAWPVRGMRMCGPTVTWASVTELLQPAHLPAGKHEKLVLRHRQHRHLGPRMPSSTSPRSARLTPPCATTTASRTPPRATAPALRTYPRSSRRRAAASPSRRDRVPRTLRIGHGQLLRQLAFPVPVVHLLQPVVGAKGIGRQPSSRRTICMVWQARSSGLPRNPGRRPLAQRTAAPCRCARPGRAGGVEGNVSLSLVSAGRGFQSVSPWRMK